MTGHYVPCTPPTCHPERSEGSVDVMGGRFFLPPSGRQNDSFKASPQREIVRVRVKAMQLPFPIPETAQMHRMPGPDIMVIQVREVF